MRRSQILAYIHYKHKDLLINGYQLMVTSPCPAATSTLLMAMTPWAAGIRLMISCQGPPDGSY